MEKLVHKIHHKELQQTKYYAVRRVNKVAQTVLFEEIPQNNHKVILGFTTPINLFWDSFWVVFRIGFQHTHTIIKVCQMQYWLRAYSDSP